jgi:putative IMPACT (imprinted ancient) family translation regulator
LVVRIDEVLRDRGSRYGVVVGPVAGRAGAAEFLSDLRRIRRYAKATHLSWAVVSTADGALKGDDGEAGAGALILKMLERDGLRDHIIVVARWYGGVPLGGDRFAHIVSAVRAGLAGLDAANRQG